MADIQVNECGIRSMYGRPFWFYFLFSVATNAEFAISIEFMGNILLFGVSWHLGHPTSICTIFKSRVDSRHKNEQPVFYSNFAYLGYGRKVNK